MDAAGPFSCKNLFQGLLMQISQREIPLVVQTAGDYGSVAQNTDLVPQAVAEAGVSSVFGA